MSDDAALMKAMREHVERCELMANIVRDCIMMVDIRTGRIVDATETGALSYGYSRHEFLKLNVLDIRATSERGKVIALLAALAHGGEHTYEMLARRKDGSTFPVRGFARVATVSGHDIAIVAVYDVTAEKQAQEFQQLIIDAAPYPTLLSDDTGQIVQSSVQAQLFLCYSSEELKQMNISAIIPDTALDVDLLATEEIVPVRMRPKDSGREVVAIRKNGVRVPVEVALSKFTTAAASFTVFVIIDVSERKAQQRRLSSALEEALNAAKLKSAFVATVSHEIRTPLNGIIGLGEILLRSKLDADQREIAQSLQDSSTALLAIINDILDFSKLEAGRVELESIDFYPSELVDDTVDLVSRAVFAKPVNLLTYVSPEVPTILRGDPGRLRQVLLNLVGNAVKFTADGYVLVSVDIDHVTGFNAFVRFEIVDSGIGMSSDVQSRLFQPFSQGDASTTRQFGGTGLGLAISKALVESMQGCIDVQSGLGVGTTMTFTVPLVISQPALPKQHAHLLEGLRTLILSADAGTRDVLQRYASGWQMQALVIEEPERLLPALREADERVVPFDLVLIDCAVVQGACALCSELSGDPLVGKTCLVPVNGNPHCMENSQHCQPKAILQSEVFNSIIAVLAPALVVENAPTTNVPVKEEQLPSISGRRPRVLVAEDNAINQKVAARQLAILGAEYAMAQNGIEAVERLSSDAFDVVLMDCSMPVMDGFTATREIRVLETGSERHVPIVAMTANASSTDRDHCLASGMDDYVAKPVTVDALRTVLNRILLADRVSAESV